MKFRNGGINDHSDKRQTRSEEGKLMGGSIGGPGPMTRTEC